MKKAFEDKKDVYIEWTVNGEVQPLGSPYKQFIYENQHGQLMARVGDAFSPVHTADDRLYIKQKAYSGKSVTFSKLI